MDAKERVDHRPDGVPESIVFDGYIYKFEYLLKKENLFKYICKNGKNRSRKNRNKCKACIGVPKSILEKGLDQVNIKIIDNNHTCKNQTKTVAKLYSQAEIRSKVEQIFLSEKPRPSRIQLLNKLYKQLRDETPEGEERQVFSENLVSSYYAELSKKYNVDDDFNDTTLTTRDTNFELFKIKYPDKDNPGKSLTIVCYCSDFQQQLITSVTYVFIDGTFNVTPPGFKQVLVIMGRTVHMNVPIAYFLLPNKLQETYETAFNLFKQHAATTFRPCTNYITDFEKAELNAVKKCFIQAGDSLQLCYFHFTQSMMRHFQEYQKSPIITELNQIANMLPFVSEAKVNQVIKTLLKNKVTKRFARYFKKTYLGQMYSFQDWNISSKKEKETISNNVVESHNNTLRVNIGNQPSLQTFGQKLAILENIYYERYWNKKTKPLQKERIDEETFNKKFTNFLNKLKKDDKIEGEEEDDDYENDNQVHNDDDEDNDENTQDLYFDNTDLIISPIISENDEDNSDECKEITNQNENEDHDEVNLIVEEEEEVEEVQDLITKAGSRPKAKIRKLSNEIQQILIQNSIDFNNAKPRSDERANILKSTYEKVKEKEPNIEITQVRSWFNNNKKKYT